MKTDILNPLKPINQFNAIDYTNEFNLLDLSTFYKEKFQKFVTLDFETTGFKHGEDEVLSCSVINQDGEILIDTLVKPLFKKSWIHAQQVHHISPKMVFEQGIDYSDLIIDLYPIFAAYKNVIIYNAQFDTGFLPKDLMSLASIYCAMRIYVSFTKVQNGTEPVERFQKQFKAAEQLGIDYSDLELHKSADDAELCRRIWLKIMEKSDNLTADFIAPMLETNIGDNY